MLRVGEILKAISKLGFHKPAKNSHAARPLTSLEPQAAALSA